MVPALLSALSLGACSSDSTAPVDGGVLEFALDGHLYHATVFGIPIEVGQISTDGKLCFISAFSSENTPTSAIVGVQIYNFHGAGSYTIGTVTSDDARGSVIVSYDVAGQKVNLYSTITPAQGRIDVTSYDAQRRTIAGTFAFDAAIQMGDGNPTIRVTNGTFRGTLGSLVFSLDQGVPEWMRARVNSGEVSLQQAPFNQEESFFRVSLERSVEE